MTRPELCVLCRNGEREGCGRTSEADCLSWQSTYDAGRAELAAELWALPEWQAVDWAEAERVADHARRFPNMRVRGKEWELSLVAIKRHLQREQQPAGDYTTFDRVPCPGASCAQHGTAHAHVLDRALQPATGGGSERKLSARERYDAACAAHIDSALKHTHTKTGDGPRIPARWGSWATETCSCGWWRTVYHAGPEREWHSPDELRAATEDVEQ